MAYFVRPAIVRMLSLSMICLRWVSTVLVLTNSLNAISLVDFPLRDHLENLAFPSSQKDA